MIEFDPSKDSITNPKGFGLDNFPTKALMVYCDEYYPRLASKYELREFVDSTGRKRDKFAILNNEYLIMYPDEGAPSSAIMLELAIASGVKSIVAFGTAGSLDKKVLPHEIIIPTVAIREEGTSYHYQPESEEIEQDEVSINILKDEVKKHNLDYIVGKTWTTDGMFRETRGKIEMMKARGCVCVEMECSASIAVCRFRNVKFAQFLMSYDNLEKNHNHHDIYKNSMDEAILDIAFGTLDKLAEE